MTDLAALIEQKIEAYTPGIIAILARRGYQDIYRAAFMEELAYVMETRGVARVEAMKRAHWRSVQILGHSTGIRRIEALMKAEAEKAAAAAREREARETKKAKVGQHSHVEVNQGLRPAVILAVLGDEALLEYSMPRGSTALWIVDAYTWGLVKQVSYKRVLLKWLRAMIEEGTDWVNLPQGNIKKYLGPLSFELRERSLSVEEMYAERTKSTARSEPLFAEET